jgi:hypothetical protein
MFKETQLQDKIKFTQFVLMLCRYLKTKYNPPCVFNSTTYPPIQNRTSLYLYPSLLNFHMLYQNMTQLFLYFEALCTSLMRF